MDYIYNAGITLAEYNGINTKYMRSRYQFAKKLAHGTIHNNSLTYAGLAPFIYRIMFWPHDTIVQYLYTTRNYYLINAPNLTVFLIIFFTHHDEEVKILTLRSAIYLNTMLPYAVFALYPPRQQNQYTMAISIKENRGRVNYKTNNKLTFNTIINY